MNHVTDHVISLQVVNDMSKFNLMRKDYPAKSVINGRVSVAELTILFP